MHIYKKKKKSASYLKYHSSNFMSEFTEVENLYLIQVRTF